MEGTPQTPAPPSAEEIAQATAVSTAAAEAVTGAANEDDARRRATAAVKGTAEKVNMNLDDASADLVVDKLIGKMKELGAFDPPPAPPAPEHAPPAAGTPAAAAVAAGAADVQPPREKTFAERFAGI